MHLKFIESFSILGSSSDIPEDLLMSFNRFVCLLYGDNALTSVDICRYMCIFFNIAYDNFYELSI